MLNHRNRKQVGATLLILLATGAGVSPAAAASQLDDVTCDSQRALVVYGGEAQLLAAVVDLQVEPAAAERIGRIKEIRAARMLARHEADLAELREQVILGSPELAELELTVEIDAIEALDRIEATAIIDRGFDMPEFEDWQHRWVYHDDAEAAPDAAHPLTAGIDLLVDLAKVPSRAAMVAQHLVEAFAKVTPRVLRSLL